MSSRLILASTSPYRRSLLERLGVAFIQASPTCDEEALKDPALAPQALAEHLARAKADSIAVTEPTAVVIGSDQVASVDGLILGKPGTAARAVAQLEQLAGRPHQLITAMVIQRGNEVISHTDITTLHMHDLDQAALTRYVARDAPLDCAGAYKLEAAGISLFDTITSDDHTAITGLPLIATARILRGFGFQIP